MTKRVAIIRLDRAGTPISKIIKHLKVPKSTIYDVVRGTKSLATPKIVPKVDSLAHVVRKVTSKLFETG